MTPVDLQDLVELVYKHINKDKKILLAWGIQVSYSHKVNNTHDHPRGGVSNWYQNDDKPKGYPGWVGRIWHFYPKQGDSGSYYHFTRLGIHLGSGGYGLYGCPFKREILSMCYPLSHVVSIFEDDWPSLKMVRALNPEEKQEGLFYTLGD